MQIVKANKKSIAQAVEILRQGGVIVYPTDTAYALGGVFDNPRVLRRVLKIKKRKDIKYTLIAASILQAGKFFHLTQIQKDFVKKYWPGPLSLVVSPKYAIRVPRNTIACELARLAGKPIIATSANVSGGKTPYSVREVVRQFFPTLPTSPKKGGGDDMPDLILNAGRLKKILPSTIIRVYGNGEAQVIRKGGIKL